ncbi:MAG TPA: hypothetical protein DER33_01965 [Syntrophomonas sp.]|nr:hypothetical protein [Syntrophomonas sp.]
MKLGIKITISMIMLVLLSMLIVASLSDMAIRKSFDAYLDKNLSLRFERIQSLLSEYYIENKGWENVQSFLEDPPIRGRGMGSGYGRQGQGQGRIPGQGFLMGPGSGDLLLLDLSGKVIAASKSTYLEKPTPETLVKHRAPIKTNEAVVGTLLMVDTRHGEWENEFITSVKNATIRAAAIAVIIALIFGVIISRRLTSPLSALSAAARRLAGGDLDSRVPVTTSDEIGALAASFNNMAESLEQNEKLRRNLIADTAHELRTPLSILRGNLECLQEGVVKLSPEVIISLHDEVVRISRLVNELQDLSLADAGELRLNQCQVAIDELVEKVTIPFSGEAKNKNVDFIVEVPNNLPTVNVDPDRIVQVLLNILGNALRYTNTGGSVRLIAGLQNGYIAFSILDTGAGIAPEDLKNIFERYYRTGPSRSRSGGGSGLGLAIAKGIVEAHGGRIWVESKLNEGSNFYFTIPVYRPR